MPRLLRNAQLAVALRIGETRRSDRVYLFTYSMIGKGRDTETEQPIFTISLCLERRVLDRDLP
jgi:hypothetical protein